MTDADRVLCVQGFVHHGNSALIRAADNGRTEVVGILIEAGADINLQDNGVRSAEWVYQRLIIVICVCQGYSALMLSAANGFTEVVGILIEAGADINLQTKHVWSADRV